MQPANTTQRPRQPTPAEARQALRAARSTVLQLSAAAACAQAEMRQARESIEARSKGAPTLDALDTLARNLAAPALAALDVADAALTRRRDKAQA